MRIWGITDYRGLDRGEEKICGDCMIASHNPTEPLMT